MNGRYHLISVAEDRMLMIWNLRDRSVAYRSSVLGAHPLRCVAAHPSLNRIAVGSDDGVVRFFSVSEASSRRPSTSARGSSSDTELVQCRHLYSFDAARVLRRERQTQESKHADSLATAATHAQQQVVDALPVWARASSPQAKPPAAEPVTPDAAEVSPCVLCVAFHTEASVSDDARGGDEEFDAQSFLAGVGDGSLGRPSSLKWRFVLCIVRFNTGTNPASQNRVCVRLATRMVLQQALVLVSCGHAKQTVLHRRGLIQCCGQHRSVHGSGLRRCTTVRFACVLCDNGSRGLTHVHVCRLASVFTAAPRGGPSAQCHFVLAKYVSDSSWLIPVQDLHASAGGQFGSPAAPSDGVVVGLGHEPHASPETRTRRGRWDSPADDVATESDAYSDDFDDDVGEYDEAKRSTHDQRARCDGAVSGGGGAGAGAAADVGRRGSGPRPDTPSGSATPAGATLSVFPTIAPREGCPLKARLQRTDTGGAEWATAAGAVRGKRGRKAPRGVVDKPVRACAGGRTRTPRAAWLDMVAGCIDVGDVPREGEVIRVRQCAPAQAVWS